MKKRRIYDSEALRRDEDDPGSPSPREERRQNYRPHPLLHVPVGAISDYLLPMWARCRSISVNVSTYKNEYPIGSTVPFTVTMKNTMPFRVSIPTQSPIRWNWDIDGHIEGSEVQQYDPPDRMEKLTFDRGERKVMEQRWNGLFKVSDTEWEDPLPGEHSIGAGINVADPEGSGLYDETTIELVPK